jgi:diadenylate cyclase
MVMGILQLFIPGLEIMIITIMVYYLLSFFWNTRAMDLMLGLLAFMAILATANWLELPVLQKLMLYVANVAVIATIIIFQPELRIALSRLSLKGKRYRELTAFDKFLDSLSQSIYRLSERKTGALVILENQDCLDEYANKSVLLHAQLSSELLESIFSPTTPLHDGAVIVRGTTVLSAATILPLADDQTQVSKSLGTRHRAGLGMSQVTDALVIVVSEKGTVSIARDGIMTRGIKIDRFKGIVRSVFTPPTSHRLQSRFPTPGWLKQWKN